MKCDIERGMNFAMIPVAGIGVANIIALMICGFFMLIALHGVAFSSMFPENTSYQITNYYGQVERMNTTPTPTFYPLVLCLFVDLMIIMGICGLLGVDLHKALIITLCIFTAPISIPILLMAYSAEKSSAAIGSGGDGENATYVEKPVERKREPTKPSAHSLNPKYKTFESPAAKKDNSDSLNPKYKK